jgi:hypothetical protein
MCIHPLVRSDILIFLSEVYKSTGLDTVRYCLTHSPFLRVQNWF